MRKTKIKLSYGFLSVIEDGRFEKEIGWNVVKEDFKMGENGEGGERGGGLILGDSVYILFFDYLEIKFDEWKKNLKV